MSTPGTPSAVAAPRIAVLDGLRGLAVLLVLIHHFFVPMLPHEPGVLLAYGHPLLHLSFAGVDLFFVLSGFFIGHELLKNHAAPNLFPVFFLRRALRIIPLAIAIIGVVFVCHHYHLYRFEPSAQRHDPYPAWVYLGFVSNVPMTLHDNWGFGPLAALWSLAVEVQFYLLAPWLVRWAGPKNFVKLSVLLIVISLIARLWMLSPGFSSALGAHVFSLCRLDTFAFGFLATWVLQDSKWRKSLSTRRLAWWLAWWVLGGVMGLMSLNRLLPGSVALGTFGYPVIALFCAVSLLLLVTHPENSVASRLFSSRVALGFGRYSYFIYLFQGTIIGLVFSLFSPAPLAVHAPHGWLQVALAPVICFVAGWASWRFFERPILEMGHRVRYQPPASPS